MNQKIVKLLNHANISVIRRILPAKAIVAIQGDHLASVYFICSGLVRLYRSEEDGKELLIGLLGSNELLGEIEFFLNVPLFCHIQCEYETHLMEIDYPGFRSLIDVNDDFRSYLFRSLSSRLHQFSARAGESISHSIDDYLLRLIRANAVQGVKFTRRMYADYLGVSERTVNRSVKRLEDKGSITRVNRSLRILEMP